ncbi:helix-hairpin-helix domain-containing protein [Arthrobacter sp. UYCu712]|uniref:helix-hairpin-helix domain-containing protein n=1 Tax=Arthrobacter sp. UYCu712 TaxID=3156340 RepID=UPI0033911C12
MSLRNQARRDQGTEPPADAAVARHRLSATLGGPSGAGRSSGLLELPTAAGTPGDPRGGRRPAVAGPRRRTGLRAAALLGAVSAVLGAWFWWHAATGAPEVVPLSEVSSAGAQEPDTDGNTASNTDGNNDGNTDSAPSRAGPGTEAAGITVHVAGAVVRPGIVALPAGSRLHEAIAAAGGATGTGDPDRLNLAAVLDDGQKIIVPEKGQPDAAPRDAGDPGDAGESAGAASGGTTGGTAGGKINLNSAGVEELATLPRVGPVLAQRIVDWRKQHGRFQAVEELDAVDGVGPKLLEALLPLVRV